MLLNCGDGFAANSVGDSRGGGVGDGVVVDDGGKGGSSRIDSVECRACDDGELCHDSLDIGEVVIEEGVDVCEDAVRSLIRYWCPVETD